MPSACYREISHYSVFGNQHKKGLEEEGFMINFPLSSNIYLYLLQLWHLAWQKINSTNKQISLQLCNEYVEMFT